MVTSTDVECHSCLTSCKMSKDNTFDPGFCDCHSNNNTEDSYENATTCAGSQCFVKVEYFPDESIAILQKGCVQNLPQGVNSCHYAGQLESVHCYCQGHLCNNKGELNSYTPISLPTVECCECSKPGGDICPEDTCLRSCTGNYCLIDFDGVEQGCGMGLPRLQNFLLHGCICTKPSGMCNQLNTSRNYQIQQVIARRVDDQNYCYSLHQRSDKPFDKEIFRIADTCEGHYCFISLTTSEMVIEMSNNTSEHQSTAINYKGVARPKYELLAGCLKVDDDKKVSVGCTSEYLTKETPLSKHCICDSHLCNYFDKLHEESFDDSPDITANALSSSVLHDETEPVAHLQSQLLYHYIFMLSTVCYFCT
uniref:Uncharacterized protein n=1 Tax=Ditylenchus dipsaci TaxID=166011 RepID=A0A915CYP7_9BILA